MMVTPACYAHITQKLMGLSCGRVVAILEVCVFSMSKIKLL